MKKQLLILLATSALLIGCGQKQESNDNTNKEEEEEKIVYVDEATIKLNDGTSQKLTNTQLSEDEYQSLTNKLNTSPLDFNYKFTSGFFNTTIEGQYANYGELSKDGYSQFYYLSAKKDKDEMVLASRKIESETLSDNLEYGLHDSKLEYGISNVNKDRYYSDSIPTQYPSMSDPSYEKMSLNHEVYMAFNDVRIMMNFSLIRTSLTFGGITYNSDEWGNFSDPTTHTHKLSEKYLIIEETSKGAPVELPASMKGQSKDGFWNTLTKGNYRYTTTFYFDLNTSNLVRIDCDYNTLDPIIRINTNFKVQATLKFNINNFDNLVKKVNDSFTTFQGFEGVSKH